MKLCVVKIGKPATAEAKALASLYLKRLKPFVPTESEEVKERWNRAPGFLVTLDEHGETLSSEALAGKLKKWSENPAIKRVNFVIGGPYGLPPELAKEADFSWSLSPATFPSDLAWVLACEQIYRAYTLLKGMPYHHA